MVRTLWVTNDFPPRTGGIEVFLARLVTSLDPAATRVLASDWPGAAAHDAALPYRVDRVARRPLLPGPRLRARLREALDEHEPQVVVFGAAWPLAVLAADLDRPSIALTHGHEAGMAAAGLGWLVRPATRHLTAVTVISGFTEAALGPAITGPAVHRLPPGIDTRRFSPQVDGRGFRARHGVPADAPLVVTVGRLVRRKGQDTLIEAWPHVRARFPTAHLLVAGDGPLAPALRRRARRLRLDDAVTFAGPVSGDDLAACHAAADVFAMPCRTRLGGLDVEGLGIVFLEAQACGKPVVAGDSGGAPEALVDGRTGTVVDGRSPGAVASAVGGWLADRSARERAGADGRAFVESSYAWPVIVARFQQLLGRLAEGHRGG